MHIWGSRPPKGQAAHKLCTTQYYICIAHELEPGALRRYTRGRGRDGPGPRWSEAIIIIKTLAGRGDIIKYARR